MKIELKKLVAMLCIMPVIAGGFAGCSSKGDPAANTPSTETASPAEDTSKTDSEPSTEEKKKIGILQLLEHDALNATYEGFIDGLAEAGFEDGKNITIDYQNAQNEQANCQTIATKFVNDKADLILALSTPAAQAVANVTKDIPVLISAVTDPADAKLVESNEAPGRNVTGTSDLTPVAEQIELLKQLCPNTKTIALLYTSSESNSKFQVELARQKAEELGINAIDYTISNSNEIQQVVQSMVGKVDAIYAPTDNIISAGMVTVGMVANSAKLPVICGESGMVANGGLATYGINYYNLGKLTAAQAVGILRDGRDPAQMPIEYLKDCDLTINDEVAKTLGITIPEDLIKG